MSPSLDLVAALEGRAGPAKAALGPGQTLCAWNLHPPPPSQHFPPPAEPAAYQPPRCQDGLGIAGFVVSFAGLALYLGLLLPLPDNRAGPVGPIVEPGWPH